MIVRCDMDKCDTARNTGLFTAAALRGVLFDMDGLIFDTERLGREGWLYAGGQLGLDIPDQVIAAMRGTGVDRCRALFNEAVPGGMYDEAHEIRLEYAQRWIDAHGVPVKPGLRELLGYLRREGIPAVLATSTPRERAELWLEMAEVRAYFAASVCGAEAVRPKPAPDIFLAAAAAIPADPAQCVMLEDSPNGLRAAKAAGCRAIVVPDLTPAPPPGEGLWDAKAEDLTQVISLLRQMNA